MLFNRKVTNSRKETTNIPIPIPRSAPCPTSTNAPSWNLILKEAKPTFINRKNIAKGMK